MSIPRYSILGKYSPDEARDERGRWTDGGATSAETPTVPEFKTWDDARGWFREQGIILDDSSLKRRKFTPENIQTVAEAIVRMDEKFGGVTSRLTKVQGTSIRDAFASVSNLEMPGYNRYGQMLEPPKGVGVTLNLDGKLGRIMNEPDYAEMMFEHNAEFFAARTIDDLLTHELSHVVKIDALPEQSFADAMASREWNRQGPIQAAVRQAFGDLPYDRTFVGKWVTGLLGEYATAKPAEFHAEANVFLGNPDRMAQLDAEDRDALLTYQREVNRNVGREIAKAKEADNEPLLNEYVCDFGLPEEFWRKMNEGLDEVDKSPAVAIGKYREDQTRDSHGRFSTDGGLVISTEPTDGTVPVEVPVFGSTLPEVRMAFSYDDFDKKRQIAVEPSLTDAELGILDLWVDTSNEVRVNERATEVLDGMCQRLPKVEGIVYRGIKNPMSSSSDAWWRSQLGKQLEFNAPSSTSVDPGMAATFGRHTLLEINAKDDQAAIVPRTNGPIEDEAILATGKYIITDVRDSSIDFGSSNERTIVHLEPVPTDEPTSWVAKPGIEDTVGIKEEENPLEQKYSTMSIDGIPIPRRLPKTDVERVFKYNPDQARDSHGRFSLEGSTASEVKPFKPKDLVEPKHDTHRVREVVIAAHDAAITAPKVSNNDAAAFLARNLREFEQAGGHVYSVTSKDADIKSLDKLKSKLEDVDDAASKKALDENDKQKSEDWNALREGVHFTSLAIQNSLNGSWNLLLAVDGDGKIAGAMSYIKGGEGWSHPEPYFGVGYLGSLQTIPGVGSALQVGLLEAARDANLPVESTAAYNSVDFHRAIGRTFDTSKDADEPESSWSINDIHGILSNIKSLAATKSIEITDTKHPLDAVSPLWQADENRDLYENIPTYGVSKSKSKVLDKYKESQERDEQVTPRLFTDLSEKAACVKCHGTGKFMDINYEVANCIRCDALRKYSPDQQRDERGRWAKADGDSSNKGTPAPDYDPHKTNIIDPTPGVSRAEIIDYLTKYGRAYEGEPLPKGYKMGTPNECFSNATHLAWNSRFSGDTPIDYCEGIATLKSEPFLSIMHGWCVDAEGHVIDNSVENPEDFLYYGVRYDYDKYNAFMAETGFFGVLGGIANVGEIIKNANLVAPNPPILGSNNDH